MFQGETDRAAINVCKGSSDGSIPDRVISPDVLEEHASSSVESGALGSEPSALDELTLAPEELEKREEEALRYETCFGVRRLTHSDVPQHPQTLDCFHIFVELGQCQCWGCWSGTASLRHTA